MKKIIGKFFSYQIDPLDDYKTILGKIVKWILVALVAVGAPAVTIGVIEAIHLHQPKTALLYIALFIPALILLIFRKSFNYKFSAFIIVLPGFQDTFCSLLDQLH